MGRGRKPTNHKAWSEESIRQLMVCFAMDFSDEKVNCSRRETNFIQKIFTTCQEYAKSNIRNYKKKYSVAIMMPEVKKIVVAARKFQLDNAMESLGRPKDWLFSKQTESKDIILSAQRLMSFICRDKKMNENDFKIKLTEMLGIEYIENYINENPNTDDNLRTPAAWAEHILSQFGYGSRSIIREAVRKKDSYTKNNLDLVYRFIFTQIFPLPENIRENVLDIIKPHIRDINYSIIAKQNQG